MRSARRRSLRPPPDDDGSAAAELALAIPAVVLTLLLGVGALSAAARQVALQDASADAARLLGRGESAGAAAAVSAVVPGASMSSRASGDIVCVTAHAEVVLAAFRIPLGASSCALDGGR
ncbi:TadE family type IV pilus minor pilin [Microbacterium sp. NPDC089696]|uniref:TadE family type IV pilus minor pilin n=1 Tax=Microbacterium sp. NPDC089696 TaxID=3364199 RepID=UPI0038014543